MSKWRKTRDYRVWRVAVIRKGKICDICGSRKHRHAHHLESGAYNVKLRFVVKNGVVLCKYCHMNYHNNFNRSYRIKTTRYNYNNFKSLVKYLKTVL